MPCLSIKPTRIKMNKFNLDHMNQDPVMQQASYDYEIKTGTSSRSFAALMRNVYTWMALALLITAFTALYCSSNLALMSTLFSSNASMWGVLIAQLAVVIILTSRLHKMSFAMAGLLFAVYSILTGVTMSTLFMVFTSESIASTFFITAGTFGAMSLFGYITRKDLTGLGKYLIMALIGLIIASLVNLFLQSTTLMWITSYIGVLIFVGLTAYDTQKIKQMLMVHGTEVNDSTMKLALMGSFTLYLDFINLFIYLLQFMGKRE